MNKAPSISPHKAERSRLTGYAPLDAARRLRDAGLRPTRQRIALYCLLFGQGDRHVTAEMLYGEARGHGMAVSLATVYNTLHQLREAGLVRQVAVDCARAFFDTNTSHHGHYYFGDTGELADMPDDGPDIAGRIAVPHGMEVESVDVIVRLRAKRKVS